MCAPATRNIVSDSKKYTDLIVALKPVATGQEGGDKINETSNALLYPTGQ